MRQSTESSQKGRMHKNEHFRCPHNKCSWAGKRKKAVRHLKLQHGFSHEDALSAAGMKKEHEFEVPMA